MQFSTNIVISTMMIRVIKMRVALIDRLRLIITLIDEQFLELGGFFAINI